MGLLWLFVSWKCLEKSQVSILPFVFRATIGDLQFGVYLTGNWSNPLESARLKFLIKHAAVPEEI